MDRKPNITLYLPKVAETEYLNYYAKGTVKIVLSMPSP